MNEITMKMQADELIMMALREDITSEDVSTNAVMPEAWQRQWLWQRHMRLLYVRLRLR